MRSIALFVPPPTFPCSRGDSSVMTDGWTSARKSPPKPRSSPCFSEPRPSAMPSPIRVALPLLRNSLSCPDKLARCFFIGEPMIVSSNTWPRSPHGSLSVVGSYAALVSSVGGESATGGVALLESERLRVGSNECWRFSWDKLAREAYERMTIE